MRSRATQPVAKTRPTVLKLYCNTTGNNNIAVGKHAGIFLTTGSNNIALGKGAGVFLTTGSNDIDIANAGVARESGTIRIGAPVHEDAFIAGISGVAVNGAAVVVNGNGQLGVTPSSQRFEGGRLNR